jgi:hypothetical protein
MGLRATALKEPPARQERLDDPLLLIIDSCLNECRHATLVEGWRVRDYLLDVRNMAELALKR